jgi:hypothetical protein
VTVTMTQAIASELERLRREYPGWTIRATARGYVAWKQSIYAPTVPDLETKLRERQRQEQKQ